MDITSSTISSASAALSLPSTDTSSVLSSDFETFLQMLTAQAKYQDPLEPIDSSEYAAQLAQFSMVEQQVQSNELLSNLATQLGTTEMAGIANWIGMEARTTAPVYFNGSPISVAPEVPIGSDEMYLVVLDQSGTQLQKIGLPTSNAQYQWEGLSDDGSVFENGTYTLQIEAYGQGDLLSSVTAQTYARITEARSDATDTLLVLEGGHTVPATSVSALREAS
ncbi:MAG: flagellar hook capping FlgD N-terminal domain-containing protein [Roseobacter sp.]